MPPPPRPPPKGSHPRLPPPPKIPTDLHCGPFDPRCTSTPNYCYISEHKCDGESDCPNGDDEKDCLRPKATITCSKLLTNDGYVPGKSVKCTCKVDTKPDQTAVYEWDVVKGPTPTRTNGSSITLEYSKSGERCSCC
ncbi:hypothetical protein EGW08_014014 [Elysia chlorotica]|uniref:Uncharacterized protein n=1 Tax=Elysia chlorotica TaxID=188477 RepID=A0A433T9K1_ELYCH|nr:hypothetical protein EGW08_014014 [Elysia chlorotica]